MKKLLTSLLVCGLLLTSGQAYAKNIDDTEPDDDTPVVEVKKDALKLSKSEIERLYELGYSDKEISLMTPEEYEKEKK